MKTELSRRHVLAAAPAAFGAGLLAEVLAPAAAAAPVDGSPFGFCLNTATIMGQKIPIHQEVEIAAKAGYQGLEPWVRELEQHARSGGSLKDLGKKIQDLGLSVVSAIGFFDWAVDDDARRKKAVEDAKRSMDLVHQIGGIRLAAPPAGATDRSDIDLHKLAERYRTLLEAGDGIGVVPEVEVWGFSKTLGRLGDAALVAIDSGHPKACILPDVYHLYKGGSAIEGLRLLSGDAIHVFHINDYPDNPPRASIKDEHRVYPGDGVAPLNTLFRTLRDIGFRGMLSLELFNRAYWAKDPMEVARTGLEKMRAAVRSSLA